MGIYQNPNVWISRFEISDGRSLDGHRPPLQERCHFYETNPTPLNRRLFRVGGRRPPLQVFAKRTHARGVRRSADSFVRENEWGRQMHTAGSASAHQQV